MLSYMISTRKSFFAKSFAHKYNIDFQIERFDTSEMLIDVIVQDFDYFECETGFGALPQQYGFKEYVQKYPEQNLVVSYGNFLYKRVGDTCYGMVPSPYVELKGFVMMCILFLHTYYISIL